MSEHSESEMKSMLSLWRPPDAPAEAKSELAPASGSTRAEPIRCDREKREWAGSCNACQCLDEDTVIVVYLNTLTFRACNKCAAEISAQLNRLAPNQKLTDDGHE